MKAHLKKNTAHDVVRIVDNTAQPYQPPQHAPLSGGERNIENHILATSSTMLGVCLTVIGIIRLIVTTTKGKTVADDLLAFASLSFLGAIAFSYSALKAKDRTFVPDMVKISDSLFLTGMVLMVIVAFMITYFVF